MTTHYRIDCDCEIEVSRAQEAAANRHLALFRKDFAEFNLKRHPVTIRSKTLWIGYRRYWEVRHSDYQLLQLIRTAGDIIDDASWAHYLDGEIIV